MTKDFTNSIWIELPNPYSSKKLDDMSPSDRRSGVHAIADDIARNANILLRRLDVDPKTEFWWHPTKEKFCLTIDSAGGFLELDDRGHWFPVKALFRELRELQDKTTD